MTRHFLLSACGCAALGLFACSQAPESEVVESAPVVEEEILTAPEPTDPPPSQPQTEPEVTMIADTPAVDTPAPANDGQDSPEPAVPTQAGGDVPDVAETVDAHAESSSDTPGEVVAVEPILEQVVKFYGGIESFKVTTELSRQVTDEDGEALDIPTGAPLIGELVLKRPNYLAVSAEDGGAPTVVSDGETISAYFADYNKFLKGPAPRTFGELADQDIGLSVSFAGPFQMVPLILMSDGAQEKLTQGISEMEYVRHEQIDETPAHHLRFKGEQSTPRGIQEVTWDMWVAAEGDPFVLQTSLIQGTQTVPLPTGAATITLSLVEKLHDWEVDPELADDIFVATVPETAKAAKDIVDLFEAPPPLLGQEAPEVKLPLFGEDAGELDLASHEGKNIVILDFWATWCGPCRRGMPVLAEVTEEYKDRGVLFYAVNIDDETDEQIGTFLEDEGLALTVARDEQGATANKFGVSGIPHSVVIGKNGIVQSVHIGLSPELGPQLRRELDALLDGQDIYDGLPEADDAPAAEEAAGTEESADAPAEEASATEESEGAAPTGSE